MANYDILPANTNATALVNTGTLTFNYPTGRNAADYVRGTEQLSIPARQSVLSPTGNFSVVYGFNTVTLTWANAVAIPAFTQLRLAIQVYSAAQSANPYLDTVAAPIVHPGYIAGKNYTMHDTGTLTNSAVPAIDLVYFVPFRVFAPLVFTSAAIRISAGGTGSSMKSGIWANSPLSGRPVGKALFADNTGIVTTGTGQTTVTLAGTLDPGFYWWGTKHTGTLPTVLSINQTLSLVPNGGVSSAIGMSVADTYANDISALNIAEGATFAMVGNAIPALTLNT